MFLYVNEFFGPTIQGEGPFIGSPTMFLRTQGCDQNCIWCDTKQAWNKKDGDTVHPKDLADRIIKMAGEFNTMITITGGNPCAQDPQAMRELVENLKEHFKLVAVETQGTIWAEWLELCDLVVVSPKPPSSGMTIEPSILKVFVHRLYYLADQSSHFTVRPKLALKMVIFNKMDYEFAKELSLGIFKDIPLYLQPGNSDVKAASVNALNTVRRSLLNQLEVLTTIVLEDPQMQHAVILPQLHVLLWGNKRGV